MRRRSLIGLSILLLSASCVPPLGAHHATAPAAVAVKTAPRFVSPGPWLPGMPQPLQPATVQPAVLDVTAATPFASGMQDVENADRALDCLTAAIYYEARSESVDGQRAVAQVVLNRVRNPAFPASVCGVVYQGSNRPTGCQFTFTCDGSLLARRQPEAWERARLIARAALAGDVYAPVGLATYYHTTAIHPWWAPSLTPVTTIGAHIFYRWPGSWGGADAFRQAYAGVEPLPGATDGPTLNTDDVIRFAVDGGQTVTIHRGGDQGVGTGVVASNGINIHYGTGGGAASPAPVASNAFAGAAPVPADAPQMAADTGGAGNASGVRIHLGSQAPTG
jgi:hypothetical protein